LVRRKLTPIIVADESGLAGAPPLVPDDQNFAIVFGSTPFSRKDSANGTWSSSSISNKASSSLHQHLLAA